MDKAYPKFKIGGNMSCYKILSAPISPFSLPNYKGLYRSEPFPRSSKDDLIPLWDRYTRYLEPLINMGVTSELSLNELIELADLAARSEGTQYEVVLFDEKPLDVRTMPFYGIDVVGKGGYSAICDILCKVITKEPIASIRCRYFDKLNDYGLLSDTNDASSFLHDINGIKEQLETEDWRLVYIYCVYTSHILR